EPGLLGTAVQLEPDAAAPDSAAAARRLDRGSDPLDSSMRRNAHHLDCQLPDVLQASARDPPQPTGGRFVGCLTDDSLLASRGAVVLRLPRARAYPHLPDPVEARLILNTSSMLTRGPLWWRQPPLILRYAVALLSVTASLVVL